MAEESSSEAKGLFKKMLRTEVQPFLRSKGFSLQGQTFLRWVGKNAEVISPARDKWSTRENYKFTLNLGVFNRRIFVFETQHDPVPKAPKEWECQWREVLHDPSHRPNKWWEVRVEVDLTVLGSEIRSYLEGYALPTLDRCVTDEGLRDFWLKERGGGIGLAVLLAELGPVTELDRVLREYRQNMLERSRERFADEQIARVKGLTPSD